MKTNLMLPGLAVLLWLLLLPSGCGRRDSARPLPADAVAMVGDHVITVEAFQGELTRRGKVSPGRYADPKEKQALLEELICAEAIHQKAVAAGYEKDPQIAATLKRMIVARYQEDQLARLSPPQATPGEIVSYYRQHPERFGTPEQVRAAIIEIKVAGTATAEKRAEVAAQAEAVRAEAAASASADSLFGGLAQRHSDDQASRYRGGDIGWFSPGATNPGWPDAVMTALFQLTRPGDISPVIETPTAFFLVKLAEKQPARMRPLEEVRDGIAYLVAREKEQQLQENIQGMAKQGLPIRINQALIETMAAPTEAPPPAVPGVAAAQTRRGP